MTGCVAAVMATAFQALHPAAGTAQGRPGLTCGDSLTHAATVITPKIRTASLARLPACVLQRPVVPAPTRTIRVAAGGDLQSALNSAEYGDEIVLDAGATYRGAFVLPRKAGNGWITIRSGGALPAAGTRVTPANAAAMARLIPTHWVESAIRTAEGARNYRLVGLEVTYAPEMTQGSALVSLGSAIVGEQQTLESVASDLVLERMYVHGHDNVHFGRCIALNSARTLIVDSHVSDCHSAYNHAQAIAGWNGPGPFRIENNYIEGAAQGVIFGGSDPSIANLSPSDIVIRRNHFFTPGAWSGKYVVFAQLEFKHAIRTLVEGNVFDFDGNQKFSQLWKSVNQNGSAPWSVTKDLTFRWNVIRNAGGGFNIAGRPEAGAAVPAHRITVHDNTIGMVSGMSLMVAETDDLTIVRNTWSGKASHGLVFNGPPMRYFTFAANVIVAPAYQVFSPDGFGQAAVAAHTTGYSFVRGNAFVEGDARYLPDGSLTPSARMSVPGVGADRERIGVATRDVIPAARP